MSNRESMVQESVLITQVERKLFAIQSIQWKVVIKAELEWSNNGRH